MATVDERIAEREVEVTAALEFAARYNGRSVDSLRAELDAELPVNGLPMRALRRLILAQERSYASHLAHLRASVV